MITDNNISRKTAEKLLKIKAIKLSPNNPFTWASGWKSPIYCDNRVALSHPEVRSFLKKGLAWVSNQHYPKPDVIAGVATGAIALGVLVADLMDLPFVYVRPEPKKHGRQNLIEGELAPGQKVLIVEDLISTGGSSLKALESLREAGAEVLGMVAIFTYGFGVSEDNFKGANCELITLSNYEHLIEEAAKLGYIAEKNMETLAEWRKSPDTWMAKHTNTQR